MRNTIIIFISLVLLIPSAQAFTIINIYIDESGDALFLGETDETPNLPSGIFLNNGEITGKTSAISNKQGELWELILAIENSDLNIILPNGAVVKQTNAEEFYLDDNQLSLYFKGDAQITYSIGEISKPLIPKANIPIIVIILLILLIIVIYLLNYKNREKTHRNQPEKQHKKKDTFEIIKQVLSEREKLILNKLKQTGKIKSSYLRKMCDIPKASFSRHIQELEKKGIIKRTGDGKNKTITLRRNF